MKHSAQQNASHHSWWYCITPFIVIPLVTVLAYLPSLHYAFQFDDLANITKHFQIRHYSLSKLFLSGTRWIIFWLNSLYYHIDKFNPFYYRVGNVAIHTINALLVFAIITYLFKRLRNESFFKTHAEPLAWITAFLFALHPVQTQTVSYVIQGQLEGISTMGMLAMVLCFAGRSHTKNNIIKILLTTLLLSIALLICGTKEIAIVSPLLILLTDWFCIAQGSWDNLKKRLWIHAALTCTVFGMYIYLLKPHFFAEILGLQKTVKNNIGNIITSNPQTLIKPYDYLISEFKVILHYLWIFIWPLNISVEYDWMLCQSFFSPDCLVPFICVMTLAGYIVRRLMHNPSDIISFCMLWFAIAIAPRATIVPSPELLVDYKTYPASFGWLLLLAAALIKIGLLLAAWIPRLQFKQSTYTHACAYGLLLAIPLCLMTIKRNIAWSSGINFWGNIIQNAPGKARAYNNYGVELSQNLKRFKDSIPYFQKAISMDKYYPDPLNNLAVAYAQTKELDKAIDALKQSLKINPYYPEGYNNIASFFLDKKEYGQSKRALETALKLRPHYGKAYFNKGRLHLELDEKEEAWQCFKKCCTEADMDTEQGFKTYGRVSIALHKWTDAIFALTKAYEINANNNETLFELASSYFGAKQYDAAIKTYNALLKRQPKNPNARYNLAESVYMMNDHQQALELFQTARTHAQHGQKAQIQLRIASCQEALGNPVLAKQELQKVLDMPVPDYIKKSTEALLVQLNKKYQAM